MRKFLPYIFILTILAGLLSPLATINAADPKGTCIAYSDKGQLSSLGGMTKALCNTSMAQDPAYADPSISVSWTPDDPPRTPIILKAGGTTDTVSPDPNQNIPGFCIVSGTRGAGFLSTWAGAIGQLFTSLPPNTPAQFQKPFPNVTAFNCTYLKISKIDQNVSADDHYVWSKTDTTAAIKDQAAAAGKESALDQAVYNVNCWLGLTSGGFSVSGCAVQILYFGLYMPASFLLWLCAYFFNALIAVSLSSTLLKSGFVPTAWGVVRDLSNVFFILILLYIAIEMILGIGGHDAKKMIAKVIIIALLINFSMFFTQVVIDSSNILALVFYNKLNVNTKQTSVSANGQSTTATVAYTPVTGESDQDIAGAMTNAFNPTKLLSPQFFTTASALPVPAGYPPVSAPPSNGIIAGVLIIAGTIMIFAAYCFFLSGLSFLGRLVELWVLIIFSPFAFMSSTVPKLSGTEYIGWDAWFKQLITSAFMAPIFMFFMYFIFLLVRANLFSGIIIGTGTINTILSVVIPAMFILILLLKATKFAKEGSGKFGEVLDKGGKMVTGVVQKTALGIATGGAGLAMGAAAAAGRGSVGRLGAKFANSNFAKSWERSGILGGEYARRAAEAVGSSNFDIRSAKIGGKSLASTFGEGSKGGFVEKRKEWEESRQKRAESLNVGPDEELMQQQNAAEDAHQELLQRDGNAHEIEVLDKRIKIMAERASAAARDSKLQSSRAVLPGGGLGAEGSAINPATGNTFAEDARLAMNNRKDAEGERLAIKNASMFRRSDGRIIDHRDATVDNNLSEDAITGIGNTANAAVFAVGDTAATAARDAAAAAAAPGNVALANIAAASAAIAAAAPNNAAIAVAARDAALAARAVTAAAADPANAALAAASVAAQATATASQGVVAGLAPVNPADANEVAALTEAQRRAADALGRIANGTTGRSINNLEDTDIPAAHHAVEHETRQRQRDYAVSVEGGFNRVKDFVFSGGQNSYKGSRSAAHKIRMGAKLDSGSGGKGGEHH